MSKTFVRLAIITAALSCSAAFADTQNLTVSATVSGTCKLTAPPAMSFTLDPSVGGNASSSSAITYKCTKGQAAGTFSVNSVTNGTTGVTGTLTNAGTDTIAYAITWAAPAAFTGTGFGSGSTSNTVTLNGAIAGTAYQNVSAGTYTASVPITIAP